MSVEHLIKFALNKMKPTVADTDLTVNVNINGNTTVEKTAIKQELEEIETEDIVLETAMKNKYDDIKIKIEDIDLKIEYDNTALETIIKNKYDSDIKIEDIDLKIECDDTCSVDRYENNGEMLPKGGSEMNTFSTGNKGQNRSGKTKNFRKNIKCFLCTGLFSSKQSLCNHLLKIHQHRKYKRKSPNGCTGKKERYKYFQCHLCLSRYTSKITLDDHLLKFHECRDITREIHECDKCGFASIYKHDILQHNLKHGIKDETLILKCEHCNFETYRKRELVRHNNALFAHTTI